MACYRSGLLDVAASIGALVLVAAVPAAATTLDLASAYTTVGPGGTVLSNQAIGGRTGVMTLDRGSDPSGWANVWGYAGADYTAAANFGLQSTAYQGSFPVGWAAGAGAMLSDVASAGFDYYINSGSFSGGIRLSMYVYSPESSPGSEGFLQFDLGYLLSGQTAGQWYSTGNYLANGSPINGAFYSAAYGDSQFSGHKTFQEIVSILGGWHVYSIGIINDTGNVVSIDNFTVQAVPGSGLAAIGTLGLAGMARRRRH